MSLLALGQGNFGLLNNTIDIQLKPAIKAIADMIMKEEEILFPMTMDKLTDENWYEIYEQTNEIGYCLYDPKVEWTPVAVMISGKKIDRGQYFSSSKWNTFC